MKRGKIFAIFIMGVLFLLPFIFAEDNILSGSIGFTVNVKGGLICNRNLQQWENYSANPSNPIIRSATGPTGNCYSPFGINNDTGAPDTMCCPLYYTCVSTGEVDNYWPGQQRYGCQMNAKSFCNEFNASESECTGNNSGNIATAINTISSMGLGSCGSGASWTEPGVKTCRNITRCTCTWNSTMRTCGVSQNVSQDCYTTAGIQQPIVTVGGCDWAADNTEDHCNDGLGYIKFYWKGTPRGTTTEPMCDGRLVEQTIDCSSIVMMNFFDEKMFIITLFLLGIIYSLQIIISKNKK